MTTIPLTLISNGNLAYIVFNSERFFVLFLMEKNTQLLSEAELKYSAKIALTKQAEPLGYQFMNTQLVVQDRCIVTVSWPRK